MHFEKEALARLDRLIVLEERRQGIETENGRSIAKIAAAVEKALKLVVDSDVLTPAVKLGMHSSQPRREKEPT